MSQQPYGNGKSAKSAPSQPLMAWLALQYDLPPAAPQGPWASAWDGHGLAALVRLEAREGVHR